MIVPLEGSNDVDIQQFENINELVPLRHQPRSKYWSIAVVFLFSWRIHSCG